MNLKDKEQDLKKETSFSGKIIQISMINQIKRWLKMSKKSKHRLMVLNEWKDTQQSYVRDLKIIIDQIQTPLVKSNFINSEQQVILFPNIKAMIKLSQDWLVELQNIINNWNPHTAKLGHKFLHYHKFLIIYRQYSNNFFKGQGIIQNLRKNPLVTNIENQLLMDFQSYLIKPVQRSPKYQLLLRQYQKAMPKSHIDYDQIEKAIQKAHQVNQQNNQSMQIQIKHQKLVKLQKNFGNIITQSTRLYISEYICECLQIKVKMYLFNDMILIVKRKYTTAIDEEWNKDNSEAYMKIKLDGSSFVEILSDGKYIFNRLFICGTLRNAHLNFSSRAERDTVYNDLYKIIKDLNENQIEKKSRIQTYQNKSKLVSGVKVTAVAKIIYQPEWKIIIAGVEKRPLSALNSETYYILKFQTLQTFPIRQFVYLRWSQLIQLQQMIKIQNKQLLLPILDDTPDSMNFYQKKKNKTRILEYRTIYIQRFMNYIFRSQELLFKANQIRKRLNINDYLWFYVTTPKLQRVNCKCHSCNALSNGQSLQEVFMNVGVQFGEYLDIRRSSNRNSINYSQSDGYCIYAVFKLSKIILEGKKQQFKSLEDQLLWIYYKSGRVQYSLLKPVSKVDNCVKIKVYYLNLLNQNDFIQVYTDSATTVQDIIEQIEQSLGIKSMKDFGLFIDYYGVPRLLDLDENINKVLGQVNIESNQNQPQYQSLSFMSKLYTTFVQLKKAGSNAIIGKKSKLYIRKYITLSPELQYQASKNNRERCQILVNEIFYRFKNQHLLLNKSDCKELCGLFYIISQLEKVSQLKISEFDLQVLKKILPQSKWHWIQAQNVFGIQVYNYVEKYKLKFNTSVLRMQDLFQKVLALISHQLGWSTLYFQVTNFDQKSLPTGESLLLAGVNYQKFMIIRHRQLTPLLQIPLKQIDCKVTPFSIFIDKDDKTYRFDGQIMYNLKRIIEIYKSYAIKFSKQQKLSSK